MLYYVLDKPNSRPVLPAHPPFFRQCTSTPSTASSPSTTSTSPAGCSSTPQRMVHSRREDRLERLRGPVRGVLQVGQGASRRSAAAGTGGADHPEAHGAERPREADGRRSRQLARQSLHLAETRHLNPLVSRKTKNGRFYLIESQVVTM